MNKANLNCRLLRKYLDKLLELGLLESHSNIFRATKRGVMFLESYDTYAKVKSELNSKKAELTRILEERSDSFGSSGVTVTPPRLEVLSLDITKQEAAEDGSCVIGLAVSLGNRGTVTLRDMRVAVAFFDRDGGEIGTETKSSIQEFELQPGGIHAFNVASVVSSEDYPNISLMKLTFSTSTGETITTQNVRVSHRKTPVLHLC